MSKRTKHRVVLSDYKAKKREEGAVEIEADDGAIFHLDPPELWPDGIQKLLRDNDEVAAVTLMFGGQEQFDAFVAAGGSALLALAIIKDEHGISAGESPASSSS